MKRIIASVLTAALILSVLILPMTSCSATSRLLRMEEDERAVAFFDMTNRKSMTASSFYMEQTMTMKMDIGGVAYEQTGVSRITAIEEKDSLIYLEQHESSVVSGGVLTVIYEDSGFADGFMFARYKENAEELKLKSPITAEEYGEFRAEMADDDSIDVEVEGGRSTVMTCQQNPDKTWIATYEGFTEAGMEPFMEMLDGIEYTVTADHAIKDVRLTWEADEDFYPTKMSIEFIFEKNPKAESDLPTLTLTTVYKGWNNTVLSSPYDVSDFTEVEDLRMMERFTSALRDRENDSAGSFTVTNDTEFRYIGGQTQKTSVARDVTFKNRDGMELTVSYEEEGSDYTMTYSDGEMRVSVKDSKTGEKIASETMDMTNAEAQAMVSQLMNSERISGIDLADGTLWSPEKNIYRFTLSEAVGNQLAEIYEGQIGNGVKQNDFNGYIEATLVDGKLMGYKYHVFSSLKMGAVTVYINVDLTVEFHEIVEDIGSI